MVQKKLEKAMEEKRSDNIGGGWEKRVAYHKDANSTNLRGGKKEKKTARESWDGLSMRCHSRRGKKVHGGGPGEKSKRVGGGYRGGTKLFADEKTITVKGGLKCLRGLKGEYKLSNGGGREKKGDKKRGGPLSKTLESKWWPQKAGKGAWKKTKRGVKW